MSYPTVYEKQLRLGVSGSCCRDRPVAGSNWNGQQPYRRANVGKNREKERMKEKEKDARYTNGHLFTSITVSGMTMCFACNKSITAKEALSCPSPTSQPRSRSPTRKLQRSDSSQLRHLFGNLGHSITSAASSPILSSTIKRDGLTTLEDHYHHTSPFSQSRSSSRHSFITSYAFPEPSEPEKQFSTEHATSPHSGECPLLSEDDVIVIPLLPWGKSF
uniref:Uncharacterized protein n=1 Tax=Sphaerodactylus townsendi TaxID=933632 RepID=A0ACB8G844_9SAUR